MGLFSRKPKEPELVVEAKRPHFLRDYEALVDRLVQDQPFDQAMENAIGGRYQYFSDIEREVVTYAGLANGKSILDFGCGSGRLAHTLPNAFKDISYTGIDVVQRLLDYAKTKCPPNYTFLQSHSFTIPLADESADIIACFSVFTHLLHAEIYVYLREMKRILKPGGRIAMSFIEFEEPKHWGGFIANVDGIDGTQDHLNSFVSRYMIELWSEKIGLKVDVR